MEKRKWMKQCQIIYLKYGIKSAPCMLSCNDCNVSNWNNWIANDIMFVTAVVHAWTRCEASFFFICVHLLQMGHCITGNCTGVNYATWIFLLCCWANRCSTAAAFWVSCSWEYCWQIGTSARNRLQWNSSCQNFAVL